jgi:hypothetical protein
MTGEGRAKAAEAAVGNRPAGLDEHRNPETFRVDTVGPVVPCGRVVKMR